MISRVEKNVVRGSIREKKLGFRANDTILLPYLELLSQRQQKE